MYDFYNTLHLSAIKNNMKQGATGNRELLCQPFPFATPKNTSYSTVPLCGWFLLPQSGPWVWFKPLAVAISTTDIKNIKKGAMSSFFTLNQPMQKLSNALNILNMFCSLFRFFCLATYCHWLPFSHALIKVLHPMRSVSK